MQSPATGWIGGTTVAVGALIVTHYGPAWRQTPIYGLRWTCLLVTAFVLMAAFELGVVRVYRRNFSAQTPRRDRSGARVVALKYLGLLLALVSAFSLYTLLNDYRLAVGGPVGVSFSTSDFRPFFELFFTLVALLLLLGLPYFYCCERYRDWTLDEDELYQAGHGYLCILRGKKPSSRFWHAQLSFLVKFFFLPLMTIFFVKQCLGLERAVDLLTQGWPPNALTMTTVRLSAEVAKDVMFLVDVSLATIGYASTLRLLDTHVRSADPTLTGWVPALLCYPPLSTTMDRYLAYNTVGHSIDSVAGGTLWLYLPATAVMLILVFFYVWATIAFGLRFSNMTHRGILSGGPYAVVRHPAYAAKNLYWWLTSAPFASLGDSLRLGCWTAIYYARAITEERHLTRDPAYQAYAKAVPHKFIPKLF